LATTVPLGTRGGAVVVVVVDGTVVVVLEVVLVVERACSVVVGAVEVVLSGAASSLASRTPTMTPTDRTAMSDAAPAMTHGVLLRDISRGGGSGWTIGRETTTHACWATGDHLGSVAGITRYRRTTPTAAAPTQWSLAAATPCGSAHHR